jgi:5-methylcytosine-specific restriction endonuclease McrA
MRRGELKRKTALARKTALDRSAGALGRSEGIGRGNGHLARSNPQTGRKARAALKRGPAKVKASIPKAVREHVYARDEGRCVRCRRVVGRGLFERALHHVLPEREWPAFVKVAANVVLVCAGCHDEHERAHRRLALEQLPAETFTWLRSLPDGPIGVYIERTYQHGRD